MTAGPEHAEDDDRRCQYEDAQHIERDTDVNSINVRLVIATATIRSPSL